MAEEHVWPHQMQVLVGWLKIQVTTCLLPPQHCEGRAMECQRDGLVRRGGRAFLFGGGSQRAESHLTLDQLYLLNNNDTASLLHQLNPWPS
jgi:hypothetical protein